MMHEHDPYLEAASSRSYATGHLEVPLDPTYVQPPPPPLLTDAEIKAGVHWDPLFDDTPACADDEDETHSQILAQIHSNAAEFVARGRASLAAESGTKANPTYIHDSQDSKPSLANLQPETGRQPIPGLMS